MIGFECVRLLFLFTGLLHSGFGVSDGKRLKGELCSFLADQTECFDQQYTNSVVDLRSLHLVQRIAIVAPLSGFQIRYSIGDEHEDTIKRENGEPLIVHSSISSSNVEWHQIGGILAQKINVVSLFNDQDSVSPIIVLTACPYRTRPVYLDAQSFSVDAYRVGLVSMVSFRISIIILVL